MTSFVIIGHRATTSGDFSLNDMPGAAGRMDILCRCVNTTFFLSHDLRRDTVCYLILSGGPDPEKTVRFTGETVRYLNPDERSAGSLIKKALAHSCTDQFTESTWGVEVRWGGLARLLEEVPCAVLDEHGEDIRTAPALPSGFLLSDHQNFTDEELHLISTLPRYSVGPKCLHADHTITVVLNELDRREANQ